MSAGLSYTSYEPDLVQPQANNAIHTLEQSYGEAARRFVRPFHNKEQRKAYVTYLTG